MQTLEELNAANPVSVEGATRLFALRLQADHRIGEYRVDASHQESLHSHDAVSQLGKGDTFAVASVDFHFFRVSSTLDRSRTTP